MPSVSYALNQYPKHFPKYWIVYDGRNGLTLNMETELAGNFLIFLITMLLDFLALNNILAHVAMLSKVSNTHLAWTCVTVITV